MLSTRTLTLIFTLSLIFAVAFPVVNAHLDTPPARRNVPATHRLLRKRGPAPQTNQGGDSPAGAGGTNGGGLKNAEVPNPNPNPNPNPSPSPSSSPSAQAAPTAAQTTSSIRASPTPVVPPSSTPTDKVTSTDAGLLPGLVTGLLGSPSASANTSTPASSSTSTSASSSSTSSSISLTSLSTSATPTTTPTAVLDQSTSQSQVTVTSSETQAPTESASTSSHTVTKLQRNTIIILIAIGASIGAAGLIWTIIRKWKFRPSSSFEDRMQPIDWQPTTGPVSGDHDVTEKLGRSNSSASHGSFTSGNNNHDHLTADLPPHDFTAGAAHLAPVGGYADLQRGHSPQPDMHAGPNYRSPSPYQYDVPNPHVQHGAYYNNAAGYQGGYDNRGY